jgi:isopenicillin N synthase-like dioxygenase
LYGELQTLATTLLGLLASSLGRAPDSFTRLLRNSVSTLRLLHYPAPGPPNPPQQELCCTPHTDSGLLTLLHQDSTGGLEVKNSAGAWIPAPYVPGSLVVNIGDLMAQMSSGRFVATEHRVRSAGRERYSVPFFCEPGVDAMVGRPGAVVRYEEFVLSKMGMWIEFQDPVEQEDMLKQEAGLEMSVEA